MIGLGVGVNRRRFAGGFAGSYSSRVIADGGTIEALTCVAAASSLLQSASLLIIPSGYKASVAYAELPANGNGDLTWSRNSVANRTQSDGNIGSVAANVPRLSYMYGSCPALLLEPQRTNSLRNSTMQGAVAGTPGTLPTNWGESLNGLVRQSVALGTENGVSYIDIRYSGTATGGSCAVLFETATQIVASTSQTWSNSVYLKIIAQPNPPVAYRLSMWEYNTSGTVFGGSFATAVVPTTTSLQRFTQTRALTGATTDRVRPLFDVSMTSGQSYDFTIRIAAPQMELGAFATTWIDTTNAAATRLADTFTRNNIYTNGLISASGGTWYVELRNNVAYVRDASSSGLSLDAGALSNGLAIRNTATGRLAIQKFVAATATLLYTTTTDTTKIAIKWNGTSCDVFANGTKVVTASSFTLTVMENLGLTSGQVPYFIQAMALYPTPLSDTDCTALTT